VKRLSGASRRDRRAARATCPFAPPRARSVLLRTSQAPRAPAPPRTRPRLATRRGGRTSWRGRERAAV